MLKMSPTYYHKEIVPVLLKELKLTNVMAAPHLIKIVVNMGVIDPQDPKARKVVLENVATQFAAITGQKANITKAKKSISTFKLRAGDPLGVVVTLRGQRMWTFFQKLVAVALPRVKDLRGVSRTAFDGHGNYSLGLEEQIIFPEINYDTIERVRSLQIVFVTSAPTDASALRLLELLGMPFSAADGKTEK